MKTIIMIGLLCAGAASLKAQNTYPWPYSGNIGIGTTTPQRTLDLSNSGQLTFGDDVVTSSANGIYWHAGTGYGIYRTTGPWAGNAYQQMHLQFDTGIQLGAGPGVNTGYDRSFVEIVNGKGLMVSSGNLGIGTTAPSRSLTMDGVNIYQSFNVAGVEQWAIGNEHTVGDRYIIYNTPHATYDLAILANGNIGIGTVDPGNYKLGVNGTMHSKAVVVDMTGWSDYVFNRNYKLPALAGLKSYIDKSHHLPDMPSETEVERDGLNLGEMNKMLLKKVEELTLYLITKDEELTSEKLKNKLQDKKIEVFEKRLKSLEEQLRNK